MRDVMHVTGLLRSVPLISACGKSLNLHKGRNREEF